MARFDIRSSGPVTFAPEEQPVPGYHIKGTADASGDPIGEGASFTTDEFAQPDFQTGVNHVDGQAVVKSADGAEILIHYFGESPAPDQTTGNFADDLKFEITGGSGQFEGASGGGRLTADGNIYQDPCVVASHLEGTIDVPALRS